MQVQTPLFKARLGQLAGVKGAAAGAADELVLRSDLRAMRAAIGKFWVRINPCVLRYHKTLWGSFMSAPEMSLG